MKKKLKRVEVAKPDDLDILSAIWILASNDENPIITYEGIKYRLGLPADFDTRSLVRSRAELFRPGVPSHRLNQWKQMLLTGRHVPSWIRDTVQPEQQNAMIESLSGEDVFRSQFRTQVEADKSPIQIIEWGLQHIDRLRKASAEAREHKVKRWTSIWIPLMSMAVALSAVVLSAVIQIRSNDAQADLKHYEVTFRPKQEAYSQFMKYLRASFDSANDQDLTTLTNNLDKLEANYYVIEPFLKESERITIWNQYQEFSALCQNFRKQIPSDELRLQRFTDSFIQYRTYFRTTLYTALFEVE